MATGNTREHGADVPCVGVPVAAWRIMLGCPASVTGDDECVVISWTPSRFHDLLVAVLLFVANTTFFVIFAVLFGGVLQMLLVPVAVVVYGGSLIRSRNTIWPSRHIVTLTPEAVAYTIRSCLPGCLLAVTAGLGGDGARFVTETVSRDRISEFDTPIVSVTVHHGIVIHEYKEYKILIKSPDGKSIDLTLRAPEMQHWLQAILQDWHKSGGCGGGSGNLLETLARVNVIVTV